VTAQIDSAAFRKDLAAAGEKLTVEAAAALRRTAVAAATYAKLSRLYKSHTYGLRSSIHSSILNPTHARVSANARYAGYVEEGTRSHFIFPRRKKALRFMQNGAIRFARWVFHPGTKARPFMQEAATKAEPLFERLCHAAVDSSFR
jgi:hypothetical protein